MVDPTTLTSCILNVFRTTSLFKNSGFLFDLDIKGKRDLIYSSNATLGCRSERRMNIAIIAFYKRGELCNINRFERLSWGFLFSLRLPFIKLNNFPNNFWLQILPTLENGPMFIRVVSCRDIYRQSPIFSSVTKKLF